MGAMASRKKDAAGELAGKLLAVLEAQRALGKEAYPVALSRLAELADPLAAPDLIAKAVGKKRFKDRAVAASIKTKAAAGLAALTDDIERLAGDPRLLESALETLCTSEMPLWPLNKVKALVANAKVRKPFEEAVARQVRDNALPVAVGGRLERNKPVLYLKRFPPREPDEVLAEKLLQALEAQQRLGGDAYPPPLQRLVELAAPQAKSRHLARALRRPTLTDKLLLVDAKNRRLPVAFVEDGARLLSSDALLEQLLRSKCKPNDNAFTADKLLSRKSAHFPAFRDAVHRRIDEGSLPPTIGWLWVGKKKQIFFLDDVHRGRPSDGRVIASAPSPPTPPREAAPDFGRAFDEAFSRLDREKGAHNFVSLVDLRRALPTAPDGFDAELRKLRLAGRYTLSAAEGRHGVTPEERQAGVVEEGSLLLYVSRKNP
jgi:hypothetical protein